MIIDKNGKLFGRLSIIDLLVFIAVIALALGIGIRFFSDEGKNVTQRTEISYTVEIENIRYYSVNALDRKGFVTDKSGNILGEIVDVESDRYRKSEIDELGNNITAAVPGKYIARVTVKADAKENSAGYIVGENTEIAVGATLTMHTKYANCSGRIVEIKR